MWNRCAIVQSKYRAKKGAAEGQLSRSFSEKKKMFGGDVSAAAFCRWPQAAKVVDFSQWFCLSEISRTEIFKNNSERGWSARLGSPRSGLRAVPNGQNRNPLRPHSIEN
jgi:hypothetical protein